MNAFILLSAVAKDLAHRIIIIIISIIYYYLSLLRFGCGPKKFVHVFLFTIDFFISIDVRLGKGSKGVMLVTKKKKL